MQPRPCLALSLVLPVLFSTAHAQSVPDAGVLQRETERALRHPRPALSPSAAPLARPMENDAKAARISVRQIYIDGASLIPVEELQSLLADLPGQSLTLAQLENAAQRIAAHYRERGWFVRVYLPQQDVTHGAVRIQIVEGRYGGVRRDDAGGRADGAWVERVVTGRLVEGEPLSAADLERGLLLANDLAGIRATGVLEPGEETGTTRLRLHVEDTAFATGDLGLANGGIKSTGRIQLVGGLAVHNPSGRGDRLALRALAAERLGSLWLGWQMPLAADGWRLGLHASHLRYKLGDRFKALDAEGRASTAGGELRWAWLRSTDRNLALSVRYDHRRYVDDMLGETSRRHRVSAVTLGLQGERSDTLGGGGITWGGLQWVGGRLSIDNVAGSRAADRAGPRAAGSYARLAVHAGRLQSLGRDWRLLATLAGQWAGHNLGASEKFALGGPEGVRAWPVNEGSGDHGALLRVEAQRPLGQGWQAQVFYDAGWIRQHHNPWAGWQGGTRQPNHYTLAGAGFGLSYASPGSTDGWRLAVTVAAPIGGNPGKGADGSNNDGSNPRAARFWLSLNRVL